MMPLLKNLFKALIDEMAELNCFEAVVRLKIFLSQIDFLSEKEAYDAYFVAKNLI